MEGSQMWSMLEDKAASVFVEARREDDATRPSFAVLVATAIAQTDNASISVDISEEDSDNWLNVDGEQFENTLEKTMGLPTPKIQLDTESMDVDKEQDEFPEDRVAAEQATRLKDLASKVEEFVEGEGDIEGARFEDEEFSDEEFSDEPIASDSDDEDRAARQAAMDKLVPALDASDYGKMPASYHSNSQRVAPSTMETEAEEVVQSSSEPSDIPKPRVKPIRQPIFPRDKFDGVDSDDETDEEDANQDDESDEDRPQVVGEIEIDMGEEQEEFLEFSRQALGISDQQWHEILQDRKGRGAFIPTGVASFKPEVPPRAAPLTRNASEEKPTGPLPAANPDLDSFDALMQAMDAELARSRPKRNADAAAKSGANKGKGKAKADDINEREDIEAAMDAELHASLDREEDEGEDGTEEPMDYTLIKNFLESFKSQGGLSGPVSNLAGRLQPDWKLPRDSS